jgi:RHS repeat-associated protein
MLTKADASGTTSYTWDFENRLTQVALPGSGGTVTFKYDPFGRRIQKSSASGTVNYLYDGPNAVDELNAAGAITVKYAQGAGVDEPLARSDGTLRFYEADGLGSITSLTDSTGALAATYTFGAFDNLVSSTGTATNPYRYTAREYDQETGLYYYRARYYDPQIGRFLSEDPFHFGGGDTDFYPYVSNNPLNYRDPSGKTKIHGNWCGPNWTGGQVEEYSSARDKDGHYKNPIDKEDTVCKHHDICYFNCRSKFACDKGERKKCMTGCDNILVEDMPHSFTGNYIAPAIFYHPPDADTNEHCGCKTKGK